MKNGANCCETGRRANATKKSKSTKSVRAFEQPSLNAERRSAKQPPVRGGRPLTMKFASFSAEMPQVPTAPQVRDLERNPPEDDALFAEYSDDEDRQQHLLRECEPDNDIDCDPDVSETNSAVSDVIGCFDDDDALEGDYFDDNCTGEDELQFTRIDFAPKPVVGKATRKWIQFAYRNELHEESYVSD